MKKRIGTILIVLVFVVGLAVLLYPALSDYVNSLYQAQEVEYYHEAVEQADDSEFEGMLEEARRYNMRLYEKQNRYKMSDEELQEYQALLRPGQSDVIGVLEVPLINVRLPIYHGTDEAVLQVGIGHIEGTSLPVGGLGSHSALSGHRGLPSAKLLSNLDRVGIGDTFTVSVLREVLTYEVDQVLIVDPDVMAPLALVQDKDYVTLVTCTPYGVNSHRMLVRGVRIEPVEEEEELEEPIAADAVQDAPEEEGVKVKSSVELRLRFALIAITAVILILLICVLLNDKGNDGRSE